MNFIHLNAILFLNAFLKVESNPDIALVDLSDDCSDNLKANYFLTNGMGFADGLVIYLNKPHKNCTINLYTIKKANANIVKLVVAESPNCRKETFCKRNVLMIADRDICSSNLNDKHTNILYFGMIDEHKTSVRIKGDYEALKLTATSAKIRGGGEECDGDDDIMCVVDGKMVCINSELQCDHNINCGHYGMYDEDVNVCNKSLQGIHYKVIITGVALSIILLLITSKLCCMCMPKREKQAHQHAVDPNNKLLLRSPFVRIQLSIANIKRRQQQQQQQKQNASKSSGDGINANNNVQSVAMLAMDGGGCRTPFERKKRLTTNSPVNGVKRKCNLRIDDATLNANKLNDDSNSNEEEFDEDLLYEWHQKRRNNRHTTFFNQSQIKKHTYL